MNIGLLRRLTFAATILFIVVIANVVAVAQQPATTSAPATSTQSTGDTRRFDASIEAFLKEDQTSPPPKGAILFIGSSIFRQWAKLKEQMAPLPVFNRAFGGSLTTDILYYMDKIVLPYEPKVIVYYCGSNDVNANQSAEVISDRFRQFVARVRLKLPQTRVLYVSINRAPQKQDKWAVVDAANNRVKDYCANDKRLAFIDVNPVLFDRGGKPRLELYQEDKLHFLEPAYEEFTAIIKPVVQKAWQQK